MIYERKDKGTLTVADLLKFVDENRKLLEKHSKVKIMGAGCDCYQEESKIDFDKNGLFFDH